MDTAEQTRREEEQWQAARKVRIAKHVERLKGLDMGELLALVRYHENWAREERYFQWLYGQGSSQAYRKAVRRNEVEDAIEQLLGDKGKELYSKHPTFAADGTVEHPTPAVVIQEVVDEAFEEFERKELAHSDGGAMWRVYLAEHQPDEGLPPNPPASAEDLAERARFLEALHNPMGEEGPVNEPEVDPSDRFPDMPRRNCTFLPRKEAGT